MIPICGLAPSAEDCGVFQSGPAGEELLEEVRTHAAATHREAPGRGAGGPKGPGRRAGEAARPPLCCVSILHELLIVFSAALRSFENCRAVTVMCSAADTLAGHARKLKTCPFRLLGCIYEKNPSILAKPTSRRDLSGRFFQTLDWFTFRDG